MDVRGAVFDRLENELVDEADDRRLVARVEQILRLFELGGHEVEALHVEPGDELRGRSRGAVVNAVDRIGDERCGCNHGAHRLAEQQTKIVDGADQRRVGGRHDDGIAVDPDGQEVMPLGELDG